MLLLFVLCVQPFDFIFLDEPVSHLDDGNGKIMAEILHEEAEKQGAGIIVTSIGKHIPLNYDRYFLCKYRYYDLEVIKTAY